MNLSLTNIKKTTHLLLLFIIISFTINYLINDILLNLLREYITPCKRFVLWYISFYLVFSLMILFFLKSRAKHLFWFAFSFYPIVNIIIYKYNVITSKYTCDIVNFCPNYFGVIFEYISILFIITCILLIRKINKKALLLIPILCILEFLVIKILWFLK